MIALYDGKCKYWRALLQRYAAIVEYSTRRTSVCMNEIIIELHTTGWAGPAVDVTIHTLKLCKCV
jgi:hypothetical protein